VTKDIKRLMGRLVEQGFTYELSKQGRLLIYRNQLRVCSIPAKTGGVAMKAYVSRLKEAGFRV
jgi:hypothetical protein